MTYDDPRAGGSGEPDSRALVRPWRWRVEMRPPLQDSVLAADFFDEPHARYFEALVRTNRTPRSLRWPITVLAYDIEGTLLWEEVS